ncbi:adhesion G-protein coupled receptor G6-like isoform X2 [Ornithodoros turicata]|uniref:adhesion G-protein coupled receptor G6-like isoform X2 n=1 Tax=Ornithodoros turicata TaxID=34597 RepID=UPI003138B1E2
MRNVRLKTVVCFQVSLLALSTVMVFCDSSAADEAENTTVPDVRWNLSLSSDNLTSSANDSGGVPVSESLREYPLPSHSVTTLDAYAVVSSAVSVRAKASQQAPSSRSVKVLPDPPDRPMGRSVLVLRIIGCSVVLILSGLTLIVFLTSSPMYPDIVAQVCSEICIMAAYTCILLTTTDTSILSQKQCLTVSVCLQYFFLCLFLFQLLEALYMVRLLGSCVPEGLPFSWITVLVAGWGIPAVIAGVFASSFSDRYTKNGLVCWMDMDEVVSYATIAPIATFASVHVICLLVVFFSDGPQHYLTSLEFRRARTQLASKWASMVLLVSTTVSWATGVVAEQQKSRGLYVTFSLSSVMLGVFLITFRISTEDQVRKNLMTKVGLNGSVGDSSAVQQWPQRRSIDSDFSLSGSVSTVTSSYGSQQSLKVFKK